VSRVHLIRLSARLVAGRRYWLALLLPLVWPAFQAVALLAGWRQTSFVQASAQNVLIGVPLVVLAIGLGVRIIAGEMDRRTLEMAYTVPGGAHRVWLAKLAAAALILVVADLILAAVTFAFFTAFPLSAMYGALQGALFYLVASMGLAALFRSEITGAMAGAVLLFLNGFLTGFGEAQGRLSPLWNPAAIDSESAADLLAWTVQNRIGFALLIGALTALACARAERREKLLGR
jgi:hypothetical protein